ncbi:unnamed protein product, partial [Nippostrongylus brasiliensis]|uniref:non-specific serine/threonine protein kinase n=1 Tax=Nippostrongylus brasiliensis TaxID=27835 RepID=A0A0N4YHB9_NIPBR
MVDDNAAVRFPSGKRKFITYLECTQLRPYIFEREIEKVDVKEETPLSVNYEFSVDSVIIKILKCMTTHCSFGHWVIIKRIDEGGFGQVYKVENAKTKKLAALKAESNDIEGGSALKLEMNVIRAMTADGDKPHVPSVFHAAKRKRFCYMIMTLLGENLKELKLSCPKEYMTAQTWTRIAIQCLYSVKIVHDYGFVHRDIKPNNFVMGHREDYERARLVHILDFGLSRSYAIQSKDGKWVARRARGTAEFRGTLRYCSPNVHEKKEQGRRDDLWSLFYVFIELHCGLPWQALRDKQKAAVEILKMHMSDKDLVLNFPGEFQAQIHSKQKHLKGPYAWENAADFFKSDPIKVNSAPPRKPKQKRKETTKTFKPMLDEEAKSSDHTTGSTDVEKRERDLPTELTMNDVDKKMLEMFGIQKNDDEKMRALGLRFSGEVLKVNLDVDDSSPGEKRGSEATTPHVCKETGKNKKTTQLTDGANKKVPSREKHAGTSKERVEKSDQQNCDTMQRSSKKNGEAPTQRLEPQTAPEEEEDKREFQKANR